MHKPTLLTVLSLFTASAAFAAKEPASHMDLSKGQQHMDSACHSCHAVTPVDQSDNEADRQITQRIRQSLTEDRSLSINAQNIKVITMNGHVTLRGGVNSKEERSLVVAKARQIAGKRNVESHLDLINR